jgi:lysophospholipase L1-like esterase
MAINVPWFSTYGALGLDVYNVEGNGDRLWRGTASPNYESERSFSTIVNLQNDSATLQDVEITLPQYGSIASLSIGFEKDTQIARPTPFNIQNPIVFYGSSITQGCSASRAGTSFPNIVGNHFNADFVNLGFSGAAHGEQSVAVDIASIDMSAFIMEYDHNAETPEELLQTHYNFYKTIRTAHPDIPIIMISRISGSLSASEEETEEREKVIRSTYDNAIADGDENVYYINGSDLLPPEQRAQYLVDGKHPNDLGMKLIADEIIKTLSIEAMWETGDCRL